MSVRVNLSRAVHIDHCQLSITTLNVARRTQQSKLIVLKLAAGERREIDKRLQLQPPCPLSYTSTEVAKVETREELRNCTQTLSAALCAHAPPHDRRQFLGTQSLKILNRTQNIDISDQVLCPPTQKTLYSGSLVGWM